MDPHVLQGSYDRFAPRYDEIFLEQQRPKITAISEALPSPPPGPVLDAGCGTGLLHRLTGWPAVQVDFSREMLHHNPGPQRVLGDLGRLPFPDGVFGTACCVTALLDFGPDIRGLSELIRVVRPGGYLALSALKVDDLPSLESALAAAPLTELKRLDLDQDMGWILQRTDG
ncbi:MAG: class I SAM-dependent methyltransferase [Bradymonadia bacterium]